VTGGGGKRAVTKLQFVGVPISCKDGSHTASGLDDQDRTPVKDGHFRFVGRSDATGNKSKLVIAGTYVKHHWRGVLRLRGSRVPVDSGTGKGCDTGRLHWRATKV
jgi:hypothetical protein